VAVRGGLSLLAGVAVLAALAWWFGIGGVVAAFRDASPVGLLVYLALSGVVLSLQAGRWRVMAAAVGAPAAFSRFAAARLAGDAVASLLPLARLAGDPVRAVLAREGQTPLSSATAGVAIDRLLELTGNLLSVIVYVVVISLATVGAASPGSSLALGAATVVLLILMAVLVVRFGRGGHPLAPLYGARARRWAGRRTHWLDGVQRVEQHLIDFFGAHRATFVAGVGISLVIELMVVLQYRALLGAFGVHLDLPVLLTALLGTGLARALPTPGALGTLEAVQVVAVGATTGRADLGFVVGVIMRLHETLLVVAGMVALFALGFSPARLATAAREAPTP
jgi:glycosyltransferase 2 family protein